MLTLVGTLLSALALAGVAAEPELARPQPARVLGDSIESCVDTASVRFAPGERRVMVDADDVVALAEAFFRHYPAFAQASPPPHAVVLWDKPGSGWLYLALLDHPDKPGGRCFTASFSAARFSATEALLKKYFGVAT